jgi:hypothetical protein
MQHAIIHFTDTVVSLDEWEKFCADHAIERVNGAAGGNLWRRGGRAGIEVAFGQRARLPPSAATHALVVPNPPEYAADVVFTSAFGGEKMQELARLAGAFWARFGGAMQADEQVRRALASGS